MKVWDAGSSSWVYLAQPAQTLVVSTFMRTVLDDTDAATARATLGAPANLVKIFDSTLGADTASFDITSIPGSYAHLMILLNARATGAVTSAIVQCRFNNDSTSIYDYEYGGGNSTASPLAVNGAAQSATSLGDCPGASASANYAATIEAKIANYAGTTFNKTLTSTAAMFTSTTAATMFSEVVAGHWRSTAAINRITLFPSSGSFKAGSRCTLYGMDVV